jgi:iron(III) transport system permease protein
MTRRRLQRHAQAWALPGILLALLAVLVVYPIGILVYASFLKQPPRPDALIQPLTLDNYHFLAAEQVLRALANSAISGVLATLFAMAVGCTLAWLAARTDVPLRPLIEMAGLTPLFMSPLVGALAWSMLGSPRAGYINLLLRDMHIGWHVDTYSLAGITFVLGLYYAPYVYLFLYSALTLMNPDLEHAAAVHGAGAWRVMRRVTFPLVRPALLSAGALALVLIVENFPIPQVLGSGHGFVPLVPSQIFRLMESAPAHPNQASALGMLLLALMLVLVTVQRRLLAGREYATVTGKGMKPARLRLRGWGWLGVAFATVYLALSVLLPLFALVETAFRRSLYFDHFVDLFDTAGWTVRRMQVIVQDGELHGVLLNTLIVGLATAILGGALYVVLAYVVYRTDLPARRWIEYLAMTPAAIPSLIIGLGFLWAWLILPLPVYGTLGILVLAYISRFAPQGFRAVSSSILQVGEELEEGARVSGAGRLRAASWVTIPLLRAGLASMMMLLLVLSMRELSASIFLFTSHTRVLSIVVYEQWEGANLANVAALSLVYSALLFCVALFARRWLTAPEVADISSSRR